MSLPFAELRVQLLQTSRSNPDVSLQRLFEDCILSGHDRRWCPAKWDRHAWQNRMKSLNATETCKMTSGCLYSQKNTACRNGYRPVTTFGGVWGIPVGFPRGRRPGRAASGPARAAVLHGSARRGAPLVECASGSCHTRSRRRAVPGTTGGRSVLFHVGNMPHRDAGGNGRPRPGTNRAAGHRHARFRPVRLVSTRIVARCSQSRDLISRVVRLNAIGVSASQSGITPPSP